eukprot:2732454-Rhodomonas_salina.2
MKQVTAFLDPTGSLVTAFLDPTGTAFSDPTGHIPYKLRLYTALLDPAGTSDPGRALLFRPDRDRLFSPCRDRLFSPRSTVLQVAMRCSVLT